MPGRTEWRAILVAVLVTLGSAACVSAPELEAGRTFRDCDDCPEMVVVPAGSVVIGSPASEPHRNGDEGPQREIAIPRPFAVSRYEVTRGQYEAFVRATGRPVLGDCVTDRRQPGNWAADAETTFRDPSFAQSDDHPVVCVSWDEAHAYVDWINARTGGGYRLLSEAEWEYAARGVVSVSADRATFPWGADASLGCPFANGFDQVARTHYASIDTSGYPVFDPMDCSDAWLNTAPVGSLSPNGFGLYDMIGNAGEWVEDCHAPSHDARPVQDRECENRVVKGGSWGSLAHNLRSADRVRNPPGLRDDSIGIRLARTLGRS